MDKLEISALRTNTRIGVHAWEQRILQRLLIDITIITDFVSCQDKLANTIDYDQLCQQVTTFVESHSFALIETVAEQIAKLVQEKFQVTQVSVRVSKPNAIKNAGNISVSITR